MPKQINKLCKFLGHKWTPVCFNNKNYNFLGAYCGRCLFGHQELLDFVNKNQPIINSYNLKYLETDAKTNNNQ